MNLFFGVGRRRTAAFASDTGQAIFGGGFIQLFQVLHYDRSILIFI